MNEIEGIREDFKKARIVFLTTFRDGEENSRPMTNFNDDPYRMMWFPSYRDTNKVKDIESDPKVLITFPSSKREVFYEIAGLAELGDERVTNEKWIWWYLYWHPAQKKRFWFPGGIHTPDRVIINVFPKSARIVDKEE